MSKTTPSVTKLLQKAAEIFSKVEAIEKYIANNARTKGFSVTFMHDINRNLVFTKWSDVYYGSLEQKHKETHYEYSYNVDSNGIHFTYFSEKKLEGAWYETLRSWHIGGGYEPSMRLVDVPNYPPPSYKGTMYTFHQEKIKETLSMLPAWAIGIAND